MWRSVEASVANLTWSRGFSWEVWQVALYAEPPHETFFGFLRPIDWLKIYPNLVVFSLLFLFYSLYMISLRHSKTSNLVEQPIKLSPIQISNNIAPWLPLCFTLNNAKPISCFHVWPVKIEFSTSWFSLTKLRYKNKINDTNSRHVETIELPNQYK